MAKKKNAPTLSTEYPDCLTCIHGSLSEHSLIDCSSGVTKAPHPNCTVWQVPCIYYKKKKDEEETV